MASRSESGTNFRPALAPFRRVLSLGLPQRLPVRTRLSASGSALSHTAIRGMSPRTTNLERGRLLKPNAPALGTRELAQGPPARAAAARGNKKYGAYLDAIRRNAGRTITKVPATGTPRLAAPDALRAVPAPDPGSAI